MSAKPTLTNAQAFKDDLNATLLSDEYSQMHTYSKWVSKEKPTNDDSYDYEPSWLENILRFLDNLFGNLDELGGLLSLLLKLALIGLLLWFFYWVYKRRAIIFDWVLTKLPNRQTHAQLVAKSKNRQTPLADDDILANEIKNALAQKNYVLALSLLYRSSLRAMQLDHNLPITKSDTEARCQALLASAKQTHKDELPYFDRLVWLWQRCAYGSLVDDKTDTVGDEANLLFADWQRIYQMHSHDEGEL